MAGPPAQSSWDSSVAVFLKHCADSFTNDEDITSAVNNTVSKTETTTTTHIRPNVFLIDMSSTQTLQQQWTSGTATESSTDSKKAEEEEGVVATKGLMKLRSGKHVRQDKSGGDTGSVNPAQNESPVPGQLEGERSKSEDDDGNAWDDAEYQYNPPVENDEDDVVVDAAEVRELADVEADDDANDQDREFTANDIRNPENYVRVRGCPGLIPIWEYLGRECTQEIVELLEVEPIQQPENCHTELKHWQLSGVAKLLHLFKTRYRGGILGDEQGLGKTVTAITAMVEDITANEGRPYRGFNLIVTTKSCAPQWIDEIKKHYGLELAKKAFFLNNAKITANELLDGEYHFVVCTWQFVMSRYTAYRKNIDFFRLLATKGRAWVDENVALADVMPLNVRHVNALFSHVYEELGLPIRHLVLDEAQFAKNVHTKTYDAVHHLHYDRIMLLSGTFLANRWYDIFGFVSLIPGHPFDNFQQFMKTFAHKEESGYYSKPSVSKRNRLIKLLMSFTISRPVSVLKLPPIKREYHDFELTSDEEVDVAFRVEKYLMLMSTSGKQQVFNRGQSSSREKNKALMQAVLAQLHCANSALIQPPKLPVSQHLLVQRVRLKERFAKAREAAGGTVTMDQLLGMIAPEGMTAKQAVSFNEGTEELFNVSLEQQQGETVEVEEDVPQDIARNNPARTGKAPLESPKAPVIDNDDPERDDHPDYKSFKAPEERKAWLARLSAMPDSELLSSKVVCILNLMEDLRSSYPSERVIVFSRYLKFLDLLREAMRRNSALSDLVPLQFNGTLRSEQRSFSQKAFNSPTNKRPIFITAGSGGAGLNLTGGSQIIQCEPWWNPNDELQAQSRAWRLRQKLRVQVYVIRGVNSLIDHVIQQCQVSKTTTNEGIMSPLRREDDDSVTIPKQYEGGVGEI